MNSCQLLTRSRIRIVGCAATVACLLGVLLQPCMAAAAETVPPRPNVILIMTDDQGWWDVGVHGNTAIETPRLDRLCGQSVEFTRFYCSPVCTPTRASLMTGRYFQRTGAIDTYMGLDVMQASEITMAEVFRQAGYRTGMFGKWHLGRYAKYHPLSRGFDEFLGFWQYGFINRYDDSDELFRDRTHVTTAGYITDVLTDGALSFLRRHKDEPFFLYLPYNACHFPYLAPDDLIDKYLKKGLPLQQARVYGMIDRVDTNVGRVLDAVDELNLADRTMVIFMSDNGGVSSYFKAGLRGQKGTTYEGGIRVPFFARWPGRFPAGAKINAMAQHIDLLPTFCEAIGAAVPSDRVIDGRSILPLLREGRGESPHEYLYHQWCRTRPDPNKSWAIHGPRYKLVNGELFDIIDDPGETKNLAAAQPDTVRELRQKFEAWFADVTAGQEYARVPIEVGRPDENPVEIDTTWGEAVGEKVKPKYRGYIRDYIAQWSRVEDYVRWKINVVAAGRYEVVLTYGCPFGQEGSRFRVQVGDAALEGTVQPTGSSDVYQEFTLGTMTLPAGPASFEVHPVSITGTEMMALHKIWLRRLE